MIIGLDFDGTFTARPHIFTKLIELFTREEDEVIIVTNRIKTPFDEAVVNKSLSLYGIQNIPVIYRGFASKRQSCRDAGYEVDIWIDDNPVLVDFGHQGYMDLWERDPSAIKG